MVGVGGLFVMGGGYLPATIPQALGAASVLLASVNVAGGFVITKRMLDMFRRELDLLMIPCRYFLADGFVMQVTLTLRSMHGSTVFQLPCTRVVFCGPRAPACPVSSRPATSLAVSSASVCR